MQAEEERITPKRALAARPVWSEVGASAVALRDLALHHIEQGVCVFDAQQRLMLFNRRYAELYRLPAARLRLGMSLRDVIDLRCAVGTGPDMAPDVYAEWRDRVNGFNQVLDTEVRLRDGRTLMIHHEPTSSGGWVSTHDDITERRQTETDMRHMALHDGLTGLPNRAHLADQLKQRLARMRDRAPVAPTLVVHRPGTDVRAASGNPVLPHTLAVFIIDLDHFKDVNDTLGHPAGDLLLRQFADRIRGVIGPNDLLARLGGDEFAVLAEEPGRTGWIGTLVQAINGALNRPFHLEQLEAQVGVTIGIATHAAADSAIAPDMLLGRADMALYRAKADGRGTCRMFEPSMFDDLRRRTDMIRDLRRAIAGGQVAAAYQPLFDVATRRVSGAEALARWTHPVGGPIPPSDFIPVAESAGLICDLGELILRDACRRAASWGLRIAVNLSPEQVKRPGLVELVASALTDAALPPGLLELEITETLLLHDNAATRATLARLRAMGVGIVLDDFGTGYCSLSYLDRYPFTKLKIDRSFVRKLSEGPSAAIVRAIVTLGHALSLRVTAEGVETDEQFEQLRQLGCDEVQGYLLGRPISADALAMALADQGP